MIAALIPVLLSTLGTPASADASGCVERGSPVDERIAMLRNRCDYRVVVYMCVTGPPSRETPFYFDCARGQVGSYDLRAGGEAPAIYRGARDIHWFACRFPEFLPRQVRYHAGKGLRGRCE